MGQLIRFPRARWGLITQLIQFLAWPIAVETLSPYGFLIEMALPRLVQPEMDLQTAIAKLAASQWSCGAG